MFVQTRSSLLKNRTAESCETVTFKSRKGGKRTPVEEEEAEEEATIEEPKEKRDPKLDMKKLRYDIIRFGSSGFDGSKREESRIALAVALGAKPPKKKGRNYVEILSERKAEKEKANEKRSSMKPLFKKGQVKWRRKDKASRGLLNGYGRVEQGGRDKGKKPPS